MLSMRMNDTPWQDEGMCVAYAVESVLHHYGINKSLQDIWDACKSARLSGDTEHYVTTYSAAKYLNQCGLKATVIKVPLITKTMHQLSTLGKTCIAMMRWRKTDAGHAYVFLGVNQLGRFHFLDPDTPHRIRKFTPAELIDAAQKRSSEVVGNELILVADDADPVFTCEYCHSGKIRIPTYLPDEPEFFVLCLHCDRYNKVTS